MSHNRRFTRRKNLRPGQIFASPFQPPAALVVINARCESDFWLGSGEVTHVVGDVAPGAIVEVLS